MPLPAVIPAAGAGIKIAKGIFGGIKSIFGGKKKTPAPAPAPGPAAQQASTGTLGISNLANMMQQLLSRTKPPAAVPTGVGMDRPDKPPMSFGGFAAPEQPAASAAAPATMPTAQAANLAMPVLIIIVLVFLFLLKRR